MISSSAFADDYEPVFEDTGLITSRGFRGYGEPLIVQDMFPRADLEDEFKSLLGQSWPDLSGYSHLKLSCLFASMLFSLSNKMEYAERLNPNVRGWFPPLNNWTTHFIAWPNVLFWVDSVATHYALRSADDESCSAVCLLFLRCLLRDDLLEFSRFVDNVVDFTDNVPLTHCGFSDFVTTRYCTYGRLLNKRVLSISASSVSIVNMEVDTQLADVRVRYCSQCDGGVVDRDAETLDLQLRFFSEKGVRGVLDTHFNSTGLAEYETFGCLSNVTMAEFSWMSAFVTKLNPSSKFRDFSVYNGDMKQKVRDCKALNCFTYDKDFHMCRNYDELRECVTSWF